MIRRQFIFSFIFIFLLFAAVTYLLAQDCRKTKIESSLNIDSYTAKYSYFNINNISTIIYNDGRLDISKFGNAGFEYPKGSGKTMVYQSGFLWGGVVQGEVRVGGTAYRTGIVPGRILANGEAEEPNSDDVRVYRVREDYLFCDLTSEIIDNEGTEEEIRLKYEKDWNEWPAEWGAPFKDVDSNGIYDPSVDIPGVPGAAQTSWFVCNDFDPRQTDYLYGSLPFGIEVQVTVWGYKGKDALSSTNFRKYKLINKNKKGLDFNNMYISLWADPDLGGPEDDLVGCDSLLNLGYVYNANGIDEKYDPMPPPAVGFQLLKGPEGDENKFLRMTSFNFQSVANGLSGFQSGHHQHIMRIYNLMQGLFPNTGSPIYVPEEFGGGTTKFPFSGNPARKIGWIDNYLGDKRVMVNSGAFNIAHGDTQEVILAVLAAGAEPGIGNLGAVSLLKYYAKQLRLFCDNSFESVKLELTPSPTASSYDREIVITWGSEIENVNLIENKDVFDFKFQGYNVYQIPTAASSISEGIKIATYDIIDETAMIIEDKLDRSSGRVLPTVVQEGRNMGIERYVKVNKDYIKDQPLNNGTKYHFAVTAYYYNSKENTSPITIETEPGIVSPLPQSLLPGKRYESCFGDKIYVQSSGRNTDVDVMVIDPSQLTGHDYEITFHESSGQLLWNLEDITSGGLKLTDQTNITGTDEYYIVDGFRIIITQDTSSQLTYNDVFTFTTHAVTQNEEFAKLDVEKINVFPNPYYGGHGNELNQYHNYVMFNHLPQRVTFRIFNLAGHLVRTLHKDDDTQFYLWDLQNENRMLAPSGLYIIYIEMPDLQKVKVLKLAIVQREVVPGNF